MAKYWKNAIDPPGWSDEPALSTGVLMCWVLTPSYISRKRRYRVTQILMNSPPSWKFHLESRTLHQSIRAVQVFEARKNITQKIPPKWKNYVILQVRSCRFFRTKKWKSTWQNPLVWKKKHHPYDLLGRPRGCQSTQREAFPGPRMKLTLTVLCIFKRLLNLVELCEKKYGHSWNITKITKNPQIPGLFRWFMILMVKTSGRFVDTCLLIMFRLKHLG